MNTLLCEVSNATLAQAAEAVPAVSVAPAAPTASIAVLLVGFLTVMVTLIALLFVVRANAWLVAFVERVLLGHAPSAALPAAVVAHTAPPSADTQEGDLVAVLTAAAFVALGRPVTVIDFRPAVDCDWARGARTAALTAPPTTRR